MIVDVHTHPPRYRELPDGVEEEFYDVWRPDRAVKTTTCWDDYMEAQKPAEVSIVFSIAVDPKDMSRDRESGGGAWSDGNLNDDIATFVRAFPDRLIGFMALHPYDADTGDELERCRTELGLKGIKLGANYQNFDPLEPRALAIYERAQRHGLPVMFHQGTSPMREAPIRFAHPMVVDEIAMRYPELRIVMAHLGRRRPRRPPNAPRIARTSSSNAPS